MRCLLNSILFLSIALISCNSQDKRKLTGKTAFQRLLNAEFKDATTSPLTEKERKNFKGLDFFSVDEKYKVKATLIKTLDYKEFYFPTTTDRIAVYQKYGELIFVIDNVPCKLDIYKDETIQEKYKNLLFLPFLDKTNSFSSYKGGRFIDVLTTEEQKDGTIIIDFNKAYNPYCAYNSKYSCPITPKSNYLDIAIEAGVKAYKK